ncbi:MAG: hypothetical protein HY556_06230 [Euryarchaeota archaeon]|nr:hypothetical protein [Euryarchaeota archaeon]
MPKPKLTSIQIPPATRDRLKRFGLKGQNYKDILEALMDRVEYEEFMEEHYRRLKDREKFVPLDEV